MPNFVLIKAKVSEAYLQYVSLLSTQSRAKFGGSGQIRTADLTLIRGAL